MAGEDAQLVARAREGDREAFGAIFDRYGDRIHDFCASFLRDPHDGADATQDAFLLAAQRLEQLRDPSALRPWLYAIARSACLRRIRSRRRTEPSDEVVDVAVDDRADERLRQDELRMLLADAASGLSDRDRELLDLRLRHELSTGEVAEVLDVTSDHASVLLGRMRERVERSLGALLVARRGADDCPELREVLGDWDGRFDPRLRKRVARHVDACPTCEDQRSRALAPSAMLSVAPLLAAPAGLREQIVRSAALPGTPGAEGSDDGPPSGAAGPDPSTGGTVRSAVARHGALLAMLGGIVVLALGGGAAGSALGLFDARDEVADLTLVPVPPLDPTDSPTPTPASSSTPTPPPTPTPTGTTGSTSPPPPPPQLAVDPGALRVPADAPSGSLVLTVTDQPAAVTIVSGQPWAVAAPSEVDLVPGEPVEVAVRVDRADLAEGARTTHLTVSGDTIAAVDVPLEVLVERAPRITDVVGQAQPDTDANDQCVGTILGVAADVVDEHPLERVEVAATVDGQEQRAPMSRDGDRWYGSLQVPPNTATLEWVVAATDERGNTGTSDPRVTQGAC